VSVEEAARLLEAMRLTLGRALEEHRAHFGETLPSREPPELLRVHRHAGEPCPRCGTPIAEVAYAERETYYCPTCQTGGKVYADRRMSRLLK
jgi:formamidopyrimidine-DNA glycosylase